MWFWISSQAQSLLHCIRHNPLYLASDTLQTRSQNILSCLQSRSSANAGQIIWDLGYNYPPSLSAFSRVNMVGNTSCSGDGILFQEELRLGKGWRVLRSCYNGNLGHREEGQVIFLKRKPKAQLKSWSLSSRMVPRFLSRQGLWCYQHQLWYHFNINHNRRVENRYSEKKRDGTNGKNARKHAKKRQEVSFLRPLSKARCGQFVWRQGWCHVLLKIGANETKEDLVNGKK